MGYFLLIFLIWLNNNLGGCSLSQEGNDFYITGADSVRKKLGSGKINFLYYHTAKTINQAFKVTSGKILAILTSTGYANSDDDGIIIANIYVNNTLKQTLTCTLDAWIAGSISKYCIIEVNDDDILRISLNIGSGSDNIYCQAMIFSVT